jgi:hypothetical protein
VDNFKLTVDGFVPKPTMYIIGGGPSVRNEDLGLLCDKCVIGTNAAFIFSCVKMNIVGDMMFYVWHKKALDWLIEKGVPMVTFDDVPKNQNPKIIYLEKENSDGLLHDGKIPWFMSGIGMGGNTGSGAMQVAYYLGAKRIVLVGFDMTALPDGKRNFHDMHKGAVEMHLPYPDFIRRTESLREGLYVEGIDVVNTCLTSALKAFPFMSLKAAVELEEVMV